MLLTINGEADNGKDYTADWCATKFNLVKIAFADPMKRFCRHLFGLTVENLWGPSEKRNEELDAAPMWKLAYSQAHLPLVFAGVMVPESLGPDVRAKAFKGILEWFTALRNQCGLKLSARLALQTLGTEWGRHVSETIWSDYLFNVQLPLLAEGYRYTPQAGIITGIDPESPKNGIVIPDQRFSNELKVCKERGGYNIRVRRLSRVKKDNTNVGIQGHQSEQEQRGIPDSAFNQVFNFEEGLDKVDATLEAWAATF